MRYGLVIDTVLCFGCNACAIGCKVQNNIPNKVWWNTIITEGGETRDTAGGAYLDNHMVFYPKSCMHCTNAACVAVCPTGATVKREDGIVTIDEEVCIGCQLCIAACPYEVRTYLTEEPEYYVDHVLGSIESPKHLVNTVEKCTLCANLVDRSKDPFCIAACVNHARVFGDFDDPTSAVSRALEGRSYHRLQEEAGTGPNVYYLT